MSTKTLVSTKIVVGALALAMAASYGGGAGLLRQAEAAEQKPKPAPAAEPPTIAKPPTTAKPAPKPATTAKPTAKPAPRPANTDARKAHDALAAGEKKLKAGDTAGALQEFQSSDALQPSPLAAYKIALCEDKLAHPTEAVAAFERFLAQVPDKMKKEGEEAQKRVQELRALPGKVAIETIPEGASVVIDDHPEAKAPGSFDLAPGKHTVKLALEGYEPEERSVDVTFASQTPLSVELKKKEPPPPPPVVEAVPPPPPPPPPAPPPPPPPPSKLPAYITGGLAIASAGLGTYFGVRALSDRSDFDKNPTTSKADSGENSALLADMAFGVALTLGVTSAVLFFSDDGAPPAATAKGAPKKVRAFTATPIVTPNGGGAAALLRF